MITDLIGSRSARWLAAALFLASAPLFAADDDVLRAMRDGQDGMMDGGSGPYSGVCCLPVMWPSTSVRCAAAIFPESEVDRTRRGHRENGVRDPSAT